MISTERFFQPGDRYRFDFNLCDHRKGWAQVDTGQDASYFGTWAHPEKLQVVTYTEGDVTIRTADTAAEFEAELRGIKAWNEENGHGFSGIDGMCSEPIIQGFQLAGLGDLLH